MKTFITTMLLLIAGSLTAQTFNETIRKEFSFEKAGNNTLMVQNINGDVKVEGHAGTNIVVEVLRRITGKTQARLEKGKQEIQLGVIDRADTILLYVQGTCTDFGKRPQGKKHSDKRPRWNGWGYDWNNCNGDGDCDKEYDYEMNFTIKVPANTNVLVSTINNGDVEVKGVGRYVLAENVNGGILLQNIAGA
ncbi:MAG: hypothetical protein K2U26_20765, partial [Cyclobacteriaceae bacterium]|nr:hypothetical protein [Cyclobacteriaceae bacterium]